MKWTPTDNRILVLPDPLEEKIGSIIIPDSVKGNHDPKRKGTVIAHGEGHVAEQTGEFTAITVKVGDKVIFGAYAGQSFTGADLDLPEEIYTLLREWDIDFIME